MVNCDLCGKEAELVDAIIEGSMMSVCLKCARHGNVITIHQPFVNQIIERRAAQELVLDSSDMIVNDFADRIKKGRERKGLRQEAVAKAIAEKESVIHQLESGTLKPDLKFSFSVDSFSCGFGC